MSDVAGHDETPVRIARILKIAAIQIAIAAILLESGLRLLHRYHHQTRILLHSSTAVTPYDKIRTLDKLLESSSFGYRPNTENQGFVLNSRSFRTREYAVSKPAGNFRVVALGDSFTFASGGTPYIDHWTTRLERGLSQATARPVEVLNLGASGVGLQFELRLWQLEGVHLDPDLVVLGLFVGNDFTDDAGALATALSNKSLTNRLADAIFIVRAVRNLSRFHNGVVNQPDAVLRSADSSLTTADHGAHSPGGYELQAYRSVYDPMKPSFTEERYVEIEAERMELCLRSKREHFDDLFIVMKETLRAMRTQVTATGAEFLVMIIPDEYQVNPAVTTAVLERTERTLQDYDLRLPQASLAAFFADEAIDYLDLLPAFLQSSEDRPLYRLRNTHWNDAGNAIAAAQLLRHVIEHSATLPHIEADAD